MSERMREERIEEANQLRSVLAELHLVVDYHLVKYNLSTRELI